MLRGPRRRPGGARDLRFRGIQECSASGSGGTASTFGVRRITPRPHCFQGEQPPPLRRTDELQDGCGAGGGGPVQFGAPRGRYRLRVLEGIQVRLLGVAGVSPVAGGGGEALSPTAPSRRAS